MELFRFEEMSSFDPVTEIKDEIEELMKKEFLVDVDILLIKTEILIEKRAVIAPKHKVEETTLKLWNWIFGRNEGTVMSEMQKVQLQHVACKLMKYCVGPNPSEKIMRLQAMMASMTARDYMAVGKPEEANECCEIALDSLQELYLLQKERNPGESDSSEHSFNVEKGMLRVLAFQAEMLVAEKNHHKAVTCIIRCRDILMRRPEEASFLSRLCYNFGVEEYRRRRHEECSFWLCQSYEIEKLDRRYCNGQEMQGKVLRLLSTTYLSMESREHQKKALAVANMAVKEDFGRASLFLKFRVILRGGVPDAELRQALNRFIQLEFPLDFFVDIAKLLLEHVRRAIVLDFLNMITKKFKGSLHLGTVMVLQIELLLCDNEPLAETVVKDIIADHDRGRCLNVKAMDRLHYFLWDRAAKYYKENKYHEALEWYTYSFKLGLCGQSENDCANLRRNLVASLLRLQDPLKTREAWEKLRSEDPNCIFTCFYYYKTAILANDSDEACSAIAKLEDTLTNPEEKNLLADWSLVNLMKLAAQFAYEKQQRPAAIKSLGCLARHLEDCGQIVEVFQLLIPLVMQEYREYGKEAIDFESLLKIFSAAYINYEEDIENNPTDVLTFETRICELHWIRKQALNFAMLSEDNGTLTKNLFLISYKFCKLCPGERAVLLNQRLCLVMAIAVCLRMGRKASLSKQKELLQEAIGYIEAYWEIGVYLRETDHILEDQADRLILIYEFEARTKLNDPTVVVLLERLLDRSDVNVSMLETIAGLAMEFPAYYPSLARKALRRILIISKREPFDLPTFRNCIYSLIQLCLPSGGPVDIYAVEETMIYFEEALKALDILELRNDFPDSEILWLMIRAWDIGIYYNSFERYRKAEQWCRLAMFFLNHLRHINRSYRRKMNSFYQVLLGRIRDSMGPPPNV